MLLLLGKAFIMLEISKKVKHSFRNVKNESDGPPFIPTILWKFFPPKKTLNRTTLLDPEDTA